MELKIIMLREVSQTQKDKHHVFFSHVESGWEWGIRHKSKSRVIREKEGMGGE
jgi:hypothetical protein